MKKELHNKVWLKIMIQFINLHFYKFELLMSFNCVLVNPPCFKNHGWRNDLGDVSGRRDGRPGSKWTSFVSSSINRNFPHMSSLAPARIPPSSIPTITSTQLSQHLVRLFSCLRSYMSSEIQILGESRPVKIRYFNVIWGRSQSASSLPDLLPVII